jgi:hypothetical protein
MKRIKKPEARSHGVKVGVAWYRKEQWSRLREISEDADRLEETYDEWLGVASESFARFQAAGMPVEKVDIDVNELLTWCQSQGSPVNADSRARFTPEKIRIQNQEPRSLRQT